MSVISQRYESALVHVQNAIDELQGIKRNFPRDVDAAWDLDFWAEIPRSIQALEGVKSDLYCIAHEVAEATTQIVAPPSVPKEKEGEK